MMSWNSWIHSRQNQCLEELHLLTHKEKQPLQIPKEEQLPLTQIKEDQLPLTQIKEDQLPQTHKEDQPLRTEGYRYKIPIIDPRTTCPDLIGHHLHMSQPKDQSIDLTRTLNKKRPILDR